MAKQVPLHVNILAWVGHEEKAQAIERAVAPHADQVSVIYSVPDSPPAVPDHWTTVDYECFFGCKFERALRLHKGGILLQIQADASVPDWGHLISRCRMAFDRYPELGVWGPDLDYTMWTIDRVGITDIDPDNSLVAVRQTDGIVWAMAEPVVARMREADYSNNRLGYGIDSLAIAYAFSHNMLVLRDMSLTVDHPKGTGYGHDEAKHQLEGFLTQFTRQERIQMTVTRKAKKNLRAKDLLYLLFRRITRQDR
jgi:hypothetical protein